MRMSVGRTVDVLDEWKLDLPMLRYAAKVLIHGAM